MEEKLKDENPASAPPPFDVKTLNLADLIALDDAVSSAHKCLSKLPLKKKACFLGSIPYAAKKILGDKTIALSSKIFKEGRTHENVVAHLQIQDETLGYLNPLRYFDPALLNVLYGASFLTEDQMALLELEPLKLKNIREFLKKCREAPPLGPQYPKTSNGTELLRAVDPLYK